VVDFAGGVGGKLFEVFGGDVTHELADPFRDVRVSRRDAEAGGGRGETGDDGGVEGGPAVAGEGEEEGEPWYIADRQ
jgi:hypothetical protein